MIEEIDEAQNGHLRRIHGTNARTGERPARTFARKIPVRVRGVRRLSSAHDLRTHKIARKLRLYAGLRTSAHSAHRTCTPTRMRLLAPRYAWYFFFIIIFI